MPLALRFQLLNQIPSPFTRAKTLEEIDKITLLIAEIKTGYVDPNISLLMNRYFTYLEDTCKDYNRLVKRSEWIYQYSIATRIRLAHYLNLSKRVDKQLQSPTSRDFLDLSEIIIAYIASLYAQHCISPNDHRLLNKRLHDFHLISSYVQPDLTDPCYCELREKLVDLHGDCQRLIDCKLTPLDSDIIHQQLWMITREIEVYLYPSSR